MTLCIQIVTCSLSFLDGNLMTLKEYVNSFPRNQRGNIRRWIATQLQVSEVYVRSMCNGLKPIHAKYAIKIAAKNVVKIKSPLVLLRNKAQRITTADKRQTI